MAKGDDGIYSKTYTVEEAMKDVQLKVVEDNTRWIGDFTGNNFTFDLTGAGEFTVTYDPAADKAEVSGDIVKFPTDFEYEAVYAVGNSFGGAWMNGFAWDPAAEANKMTETAPDVWEIELKKDVENDEGSLAIKFAIDGAWTHNFGLAEGETYEPGTEIDATYNGYDIKFEVDEDAAYTIKAVLDLSAFDFTSKTGAKLTVTVTKDGGEPADTYLVGDVDGDGKVSNRDAMILDRYVADWDGYDQIITNMAAADLDGSGKVNNRDAVILDRIAADWDGYRDQYVKEVPVAA